MNLTLISVKKVLTSQKHQFSGWRVKVFLHFFLFIWNWGWSSVFDKNLAEGGAPQVHIPTKFIKLTKLVFFPTLAH